MSLPPPSGADGEDDSVSLGFEVDATPETFDTDAFTASLADELGVDAATLSTEVVDNGPGNGIRVVVSGAPAAATDYLAAQSGTELSESLGVPVREATVVASAPPPPSGADAGDGSVSLGFELDATPETFDADAFTASLADELGVDAATLSTEVVDRCLLYTSPSPRDLSTSRMPSSA